MMIDDMESRPTGNDQLFGIYLFIFFFKVLQRLNQKKSFVSLCRDSIESFELMSQTCVGPQYIEVPVTTQSHQERHGSR